jgi:hypothetical protein
MAVEPRIGSVSRPAWAYALLVSVSLFSLSLADRLAGNPVTKQIRAASPFAARPVAGGGLLKPRIETSPQSRTDATGQEHQARSHCGDLVTVAS